MATAEFELEPPQADAPTGYDERHLATYLRLLDAHAEGADWREVAAIVLGLNPEAEPRRARAIHASHLARAQWLSSHGFRRMLDRT